MFFKHANSVEKQLLNFRNSSISHCFRNSSLTIIWNNLGLSNYKRIKGILNLEKKNACYNSKRNYSVPYSKVLLLLCICGISQPFHRSGKNILLNVYKKIFLKICFFFLNSGFLFIRL